MRIEQFVEMTRKKTGAPKRFGRPKAKQADGFSDHFVVSAEIEFGA